MKKPYESLERGDYTRPGATRTEKGMNFTLAIQSEEPVALLLYQKGTDTVAEEVSLGEKAMGDIYSIRLNGFDPRKYEYNYRVGEKIFVDPYAKRVVGKHTFAEWSPEKNGHQTRGGFDLSPYDWEGDRPLRLPYEDGILYHLHVRGFTQSAGSKIRAKGTFRGVAEKVPYLTELGVNQLLLMPVYDFDERLLPEKGENPYRKPEREPKINYWGYGTARYFAPKPAFASGDPVKEFKDLVKTLHRAGIEVLLEIFFPEKMEERMMVLCLEHWLSVYHVDGFCIMGNQAVSASLARDPMFSGTKLLSPYFDTEAIYGRRRTPAFRNLAEANDGFLVDARRFLKGDEDQLASFSYRIRKNPPSCAVINYITHQDGFTLMDLVSYEERHNEANGEGNQDGPAYNFSWNCGVEGPSRKKKIQELRLRQMKNAFLLLLFSQGTPMILAGDEFGNSQMGNSNPYCQDNEISWLDWNGLKKQKELLAFVKDAIAFRKKHRLLHQKRELLGTDTHALGYPDISYHGKQAWYRNFENTSRHFGVLYCGAENGEMTYLYVAYNLHWKEQEFAVPKLPEGLKWSVIFDTEAGSAVSETIIEWKDQKSFVAGPRTILVLIGRK